jgi:hypothetical protein
MSLHVNLHLDLAIKRIPLSMNERDIRVALKRRMIALAGLERAWKKQRPRINNLRDGYANTKYFHRKVNSRRRKNFIFILCHNQGCVTSHEEKKLVAQPHFSVAIKRGP